MGPRKGVIWWLTALASSVLGADYSASTTSLGCYTDNASRILQGRMLVPPQNAPQYCANVCGLIGFKYAGVEYGTQCFCGNSIVNGGASTSTSSCNMACSGDSKSICGGFYTMNLYQISNPRPSNNNTAFPLDCSNLPLSGEAVCDKTKTHQQRAQSLVSLMTLDEKVKNVVSTSYGALRLGFLNYQWWSEALHGVANSPGVLFADSNSPFGYASSFPQPINLGASFDDPLVKSIAGTIGKEARAFANNGHAGFDFWTPNINPFRDPRWGRGQEVASEDAFHIASYVSQLVPALQGNPTNPEQKQIIATCKHFAAYDIEQGRYGDNLDPTQQDLAEYYFPSFKTCVRDSGVGSVMCSYNAVDGVPACASEYLLQDMLRGAYNFTNPWNYVTSDCDAVQNIYDSHHFVSSPTQAAAVAMNAGTDLDCGTTYLNLNESVAMGITKESTIDAALVRLFSALFTVGFFDGASPFNSLGWSDVNTANAQSLAYQAALESMVLLKNDGTLPLKGKYSKVAVIGPMAQATNQLQGNYFGNAPFLRSPLSALQNAFSVVYQQGTQVNTGDTSGFAAAVSAAKSADVVIYIGGIDNSIEAEGMDRSSIAWPGNQLQLIQQLSQTGKPLVIVQWGGGQVDDTVLLNNTGVNSIVWAGYPGQDGGPGIVDILRGTWSVAGRLPVTQYPASYASSVSIFNMNLRPNGSYPGRTYKWYNGKPVLPFGHGLHYTNFTFSWGTTPSSTYSISSLVANAKGAYKDIAAFATVTANVKNAGGPANMFSDYVGLLYLSTKNAGPSPYPNKWLVSYTRAHNIAVGSTSVLSFPISLGSLARADSNGDMYLYPGTYTLTMDNQPALTYSFTLTGSPALILAQPKPKSSYIYTVPVTPQGPTTS